MGCSEVVINNQTKIRVCRSWLLLVDKMYFASTWRLCQAKMSSPAPTGPLNVIDSGFVYSPSQLFLPAPVALWLLYTSWAHGINPKGFTKCSICFGTFLYLGISGRYLSNVFLWWFDNKALLPFYSTVHSAGANVDVCYCSGYWSANWAALGGSLALISEDGWLPSVWLNAPGGRAKNQDLNY